MEKLVDYNAFIGRWPFRELALAGTVQALRDEQKRHGVSETWVSSLDALFQADTRSANRRLREQIGSIEGLRFTPVIRLDAPDILHELAEWMRPSENVAGIRIVPNYTGGVGQGIPEPVCSLAKDRGLTLLINLRMQDDRNQSPQFRVPAFPLREAMRLAANWPHDTVICGATLGEVRGVSSQAQDLPRVRFDLSSLDGADPIASMREIVGEARVVLGTNYPVFVYSAAILKRRFSDSDWLPKLS